MIILISKLTNADEMPLNCISAMKIKKNQKKLVPFNSSCEGGRKGGGGGGVGQLIKKWDVFNYLITTYDGSI